MLLIPWCLYRQPGHSHVEARSLIPVSVRRIYRRYCREVQKQRPWQDPWRKLFCPVSSGLSQISPSKKVSPMPRWWEISLYSFGCLKHHAFYLWITQNSYVYCLTGIHYRHKWAYNSRIQWEGSHLGCMSPTQYWLGMQQYLHSQSKEKGNENVQVSCFFSRPWKKSLWHLASFNHGVKVTVALQWYLTVKLGYTL